MITEMNEETLTKHVDNMLTQTVAANADPAVIEFVDTVYRPFVRVLYTNAKRLIENNQNMNTLLDGTVDIIALLISHAGHYVCDPKDMLGQVAFINLFLVNLADDLNMLMQCKFPGEEFERLSRNDMARTISELLDKKGH